MRKADCFVGGSDLPTRSELDALAARLGALLKWRALASDAFDMEGRPLPTQAGPVPDRLSIWPLDDGSYGLDATFHGASGYERADWHADTLREAGVAHSFVQELGGAWTIRFGPLSAREVSKALTVFVV